MQGFQRADHPFHLVALSIVHLNRCWPPVHAKGSHQNLPHAHFCAHCCFKFQIWHIALQKSVHTFHSPYVIALRLLCGSEPHLIRHFFQLYHDDQALPIPSTIQNYIPNCAPHFVQCAVRNLDHILRHLWHERWCHHITAAIMESFLCSHSLLACLPKIHAGSYWLSWLL